jgi:hypothetical protein
MRAEQLPMAVPPGLDALARRARWAYERARLARGLRAAVPLALVVALALALGADRAWSVRLGALLILGGAVFAWRGRMLERALLPGVAAGLVPLAAACAAQSMGHVCVGDGCTSLCLPACIVGGLVAGGLVGRFARTQRSPWQAVLAAGGLAWFTGALGCACVGAGGVVGLLGGLLVGSGPLVVRAIRK